MKRNIIKIIIIILKKKRNNIPEMTNDDEGSDNSDKTGTTHLKNFKTNKDKSRCC